MLPRNRRLLVSGRINRDPAWGWFIAANPLLFAMPQSPTQWRDLVTPVQVAQSGTTPAMSVVGPWGPGGGSAATADWRLAGRPVLGNVPTTLAALFTTTSAAAEQALVSTSAANTGVSLYVQSTGQTGFIIHGQAIANGPSIVANKPYFLVAAADTSVNVTIVLVDLLAGTISAATTALGPPGASASSGTFSVASFKAGVSRLNGRMGLAAIVNATLTLPQMIQWARDPFGPYASPLGDLADLFPASARPGSVDHDPFVKVVFLPAV